MAKHTCSALGVVMPTTVATMPSEICVGSREETAVGSIAVAPRLGRGLRRDQVLRRTKRKPMHVQIRHGTLLK